MFSERSAASDLDNTLSVALERARSGGETVLDLTESNPTRATIRYDEATILGPLATEAVLTYSPEPFGMFDARSAVSALWSERGVSVSPERVILTSSTSEAYSHLFKLLCDPGDELLVPRPGYPLFDTLAQYESVRLVPYRLRYDGAWHVDVDSVRSGVTSRTRAILAVSPNNPTGSYVRAAELSAFSELGLPIICDEVFAGYDLSETARGRSALELAGVSTAVFVLDGLSKLAALPQMKLAWMTVGGPGAIVTEALRRLEHLTDAFLSPCALPQIALRTWLQARHPIRARISKRTRENLDLLERRTADTPLTTLSVEAGWYAIVRLPAIRTEEEWVTALLDRCGVLVHPGYFYDFEDEPYVVVSLLTPESIFRDGVERLVRYVVELSRR